MRFKASRSEKGGMSGRGFAGLIFLVSLILVSWPFHSTQGAECGKGDRNAKVVRVVIIGGMAKTTDLWFKIAEKFEQKTGYIVELVNTAEVDQISADFREGKADLLTMHSTDQTTNLVADGYGVNMRPWAHNDVVIMGPGTDPAGIKGMTDGAAALKKIKAAGDKGKARFVDLWDIGKRELGQDLWRKAKIQPTPYAWYVPDRSAKQNEQLTYTDSLRDAYCLFGRIPVIMEKNEVPEDYQMEIMVEGDSFMRRPYVVMEANPKRFPCANYVGARKLSNFLLSKEIQEFLPQYFPEGYEEQFRGIPPFHPLRNAAFDTGTDVMLMNLIDFLASSNLGKDIIQSLEIKLNQAVAALSNQDITDDFQAILFLNEFIKKVEAQKGRKIEADVADLLIEQAEEIIEVLKAQS